MAPTVVTAPLAASCSRAVVRFFVAAFVVTFGLQLPGVLAQRGILALPVAPLVPLAGLGVFGPMLAAMFASRSEPGGIRALFGQLRRWRVGAGWYVVALVLPGAILTAGLALYSLARRTYGSVSTFAIFAVAGNPIPEEGRLIFLCFDRLRSARTADGAVRTDKCTRAPRP